MHLEKQAHIKYEQGVCHDFHKLGILFLLSAVKRELMDSKL